MKRISFSILALAVFMLANAVAHDFINQKEILGEWEGKLESRKTKWGSIEHVEDPIFLSISEHKGILMGEFSIPNFKKTWQSIVGEKGDKIFLFFAQEIREFDIIKEGDKVSLVANYPYLHEGWPRIITLTFYKKVQRVSRSRG